MASEYLKWKYRDVKPDEKPAPLTGRAKRANWWHYHKWLVLGGIVLALALGDILWHALGIGQVRPDYEIAYVGRDPLPEDTAAAVENALAGLGQDCNGDGRTVVRLNQYVSGGEESGDYAYASATRLMGDMEDCESYFFLLDDPDRFQREHQILRLLDGTLPDEGSGDDRPFTLAWADCPVLAGLDLGSYTQTVLGEHVTGDSQTLMAGLYIARRGFWTEKTAAFLPECDGLWELLTEGADL